MKGKPRMPFKTVVRVGRGWSWENIELGSIVAAYHIPEWVEFQGGLEEEQWAKTGQMCLFGASRIIGRA